MRSRALFAVAGWLAAAFLATLIGVGAVRLIGESIAGTPGGVLSQREVDQELAAPVQSASAPAIAPVSAAPPADASAGARQSLAAVGGSVVAECAGSTVRLVSWAPAQGYQVHDAEPGPDDEAEVEFRGPSGKSEIKVRCVAGRPVADIDEDDDDDDD